MSALSGFAVPEGIDCPRAASWMTPCIARDGHTALDGQECVGCGKSVWFLLGDLAKRYEPAQELLVNQTLHRDQAADRFKELVAAYVETK